MTALQDIYTVLVILSLVLVTHYRYSSTPSKSSSRIAP